MTAELTLYTNPKSRGLIVQRMLEEIGQPYRKVVLEFGAPMRTPEFLALNPMGKVPVLVHGEAVVTEAAAICAYLAEAFPKAGLAPKPEERADYFRWMFFAAGPLEAVVTARALGLEAPPERRGMAGYGDFDTVVAALEGKLAGSDYVAGGRFTAADVYLGAQVVWGLMFKTLPPRPALVAYHDRLMARPAWVRANTPA
ncbi:glutathione S-transferase family protein [Phaeovulum sp.]|uniref:glutathione S-transferase family protein n=1 Tax=Phaeovulum sp. TaxID=2934796 RepID=UPI003567B15B